MAVLVRDDFTGSGSIVGRTPDGVNGGNWSNDAGIYGGDASITTISSGICNTPSGFNTWGARLPVPGTPKDVVLEVGMRIAVNGDTGALAICRAASGSGSIRCEIIRNSSTSIDVGLYFTGSSTGSTYETVSVANASSFVVRLERSGLGLLVKINGTTALNVTLGTDLAGGDNFIGTTFSTVDFDYVQVEGVVPSPIGLAVGEATASAVGIKRVQGNGSATGEATAIGVATISVKNSFDIAYVLSQAVKQSWDLSFINLIGASFDTSYAIQPRLQAGFDAAYSLFDRVKNDFQVAYLGASLQQGWDVSSSLFTRVQASHDVAYRMVTRVLAEFSTGSAIENSKKVSQGWDLRYLYSNSTVSVIDTTTVIYVNLDA